MKHLILTVFFATATYLFLFLTFLYIVTSLNFSLITTNLLITGALCLAPVFFILIIADFIIQKELCHE